MLQQQEEEVLMLQQVVVVGVVDLGRGIVETSEAAER